MTPTKDQQAQEYAEKKLQERVSKRAASPRDYINRAMFYFDDMEQAYLDGYTAAEQSQWRSVEEELPEKDGEYLTLTTDKEIEIFVWEDGEWLVSGYTVAYWRELPSLPDTNTENY